MKVKAKQSLLRLGRCGKLAPRFCGPFEILAQKELVAYELEFPMHVEPEGEFSPESTHIFDKREV